MPAGRPTEYNEKILKKAKKYLELCQDEEERQIIGLSAKGTELYKNKLKVKLPSIEGLAVYLGVARSTIYEWEKTENEDKSLKYPEFSDILGKILAEQAQRLINNGLSGDYNSTISKLILTKHGYSDKQEITGADGKDLIPKPILGTLNVSTHNSDPQNSEAVKENTGSSGRDISEQDDLNTPALDSPSPERPEANADQRSI